jgi:hypothetical protein
VCLSLLGTWSGPGWVPGTSTLSQVLLSIQGASHGVCCAAAQPPAPLPATVGHPSPLRRQWWGTFIALCRLRGCTLPTASTYTAAGQILVDTPYANEPGFERVLGTDEGRRAVGKHNVLLRLAVRAGGGDGAWRRADKYICNVNDASCACE